jgi:hypothetical protein
VSDDVELSLRQILLAIDALARRVEALERRLEATEGGAQGNFAQHLMAAISSRRFNPERRIDPGLSAKRSAAAKRMWELQKSKLSTEKHTGQPDHPRRRNASKVRANASTEETITSEQNASNLHARACKPEQSADVGGSPAEPVASPPSAAAAKVWLAYAAAYKLRYGVFPVRNAKTNACIKHFVGRVPMAEAPAVAEFYLGDAEPLYVKAAHPLELLLRDAEKLRMAWATGRRVNGHDGPAKPWWEVWSGIEAMGKELGLEQGDNPQIFRAQVLRAAAAAGRLPEAAQHKLGLA